MKVAIIIKHQLEHKHLHIVHYTEMTKKDMAACSNMFY